MTGSTIASGRGWVIAPSIYSIIIILSQYQCVLF